MVVTSDLKIKGSIDVQSFLTEFSYFTWKSDPYIQELISDYVRIDVIRIADDRSAVFTYYDVYEDGEEREIDPVDIEMGFVEVYEGGYKRTEMVHWSISIENMNTERCSFYIHSEDWCAIYSYLSMLTEEDPDIKEVSIEITDRRMVIGDEFEVIIYD